MRLSRTTGVGGGLIVVLLGIWAGLIPFVGPYFNYGFQPESAWHFTLDRLWLNILPAAAVVLGGLAMVAAGRRPNGVLGCWLALVGGAWLLLGPSASMFWQHPAPGMLISGIGAPIGGHDRAAAEMIGFFYGAGALIVALSAFAAAKFIYRPALVADPLAADAAAGVTARRTGEPVGWRPWARAPCRAETGREGVRGGAAQGVDGSGAAPRADGRPADQEPAPDRNEEPAADRNVAREAPPVRR
jgi:hypothetical protein